MADNTFRTPGRGPARNHEPIQRDSLSDPLAELARLIGQNEAHGGSAHDHGQAEGFDEGASAGLDWAATDEDYAEQDHDADVGYAQPSNDAYYAQPSGEASWPHQHGFEEEEPDEREYARSAPAYQNGGGDPRRNAGQQEPYYREDMRQSAPRAEPSLYAPSTQGGYQPDERQRYNGQASAYADEAGDYDRDAYDEEAPPTRRSGTIVIVALLGLAVLGTAGALGYRAMFGGSMIPSLPPIIRPSDTPIKIVPQRDTQAGTSGQTGAGTAGTGEQVVAHEEQPVPVQSANPVPRVVTTIPVISSGTGAPLPGMQPVGSDQTQAVPMGSVAPPAFADPNAAMPSAGMPNQMAAPPPGSPPAGSRAVQTIKIQPDQQTAANPPDAAGSPDTVTAPEARPPKPHVTRPVREAAPRQTQTPGGPLSIVPTRETRAPTPAPAPTRMVDARPGPMALGSPGEAAPAGVGRYAVQVTSQRSEAEAQAAFRSLQAKYPRELGGHRAIFRRADLGAKGIYYRALVGPFASAEQAAGLCSSLKAAGGNCLIQRN